MTASVKVNEDVQVFAQGMADYFSSNIDDAGKFKIGEISQCDPTESPAYDFTGIIGISGYRKGCIYFTAQEALIIKVLESLGETNIDDGDLLSDMCGEIANTIAGNVMSLSDNDFELTVPIVIRGRPNSIYLPKNTTAYVIPANWNNVTATLVVCIE